MPTNRVLELRIFRLHHGQRDEFVTRFREHLLPMQKSHGIEVVTWGPSFHDQDSFLLVRAYASIEARQAALDAMFGSTEWLMDQEEAVLGMIESYNTSVVEADEKLIEAIRAGLVTVPERDTTQPG